MIYTYHCFDQHTNSCISLVLYVTFFHGFRVFIIVFFIHLYCKGERLKRQKTKEGQNEEEEKNHQNHIKDLYKRCKIIIIICIFFCSYVDVVKEAMGENFRYFLEICHDGPPGAVGLPHSISFRTMKLEFGEWESEESGRKRRRRSGDAGA